MANPREMTRKSRELAKTLPSGFEVTLSVADALSGYDVDMWTSKGENHWHKFHTVYEDALYEYNRWND